MDEVGQHVMSDRELNTADQWLVWLVEKRIEAWLHSPAG